jgi:hypothetical protein
MVYPVSTNNGIANGLLVQSGICKLFRNDVPAAAERSAIDPK